MEEVEEVEELEVIEKMEEVEEIEEMGEIWGDEGYERDGNGQDGGNAGAGKYQYLLPFFL